MRRSLIALALLALASAAYGGEWEMLMRRRNAVAVPTFSPLDLSGCVMWLDADQESTYTNTQPVTIWTDRSGNNNHATNAAGPCTMAVGSFGGRRAIYIPGGGSQTDVAFDAPNLGLHASSLSVFIAAIGNSDVAASRFRSMLGLNVFNTGLWLSRSQRSSDPDQRYVVSYNNAAILTTAVGSYPLTATTNVVAVLKTRNTSHAIWLNNSMATNSTGATQTADYSSGPTQVGCMTTGAITSRRWLGYFGEVLIYNRAVSEDERKQITDYLIAKWGITP